jgi:hypothetical protein
MASMSTSLDELQGAAGPVGSSPADEERVKRILAEMNAGDVVQEPPALPAMPRAISEPPVSVSPGQLRMDASTARAHIIGNSQPTMADFHALFPQTPPGMAPYQPPVAPAPASIPAPKKAATWSTTLAAQARGPVFVAIIVFLLNMPVMTSMFSRYASWMYLNSGEISIGGLLAKAAIAAGLFAAIQLIMTLVSP